MLLMVTSMQQDVWMKSTPHILPCFQMIITQAVLQDDNARPDRANIVTDFLRQNKYLTDELTWSVPRYGDN